MSPEKINAVWYAHLETWEPSFAAAVREKGASFETELASHPDQDTYRRMYEQVAADADKLEEEFWHQQRDVPDLDTSRVAVRRAMEIVLVRSSVAVAVRDMGVAAEGVTVQ